MSTVLFLGWLRSFFAQSPQAKPSANFTLTATEPELTLLWVFRYSSPTWDCHVPPLLDPINIHKYAPTACELTVPFGVRRIRNGFRIAPILHVYNVSNSTNKPRIDVAQICVCGASCLVDGLWSCLDRFSFFLVCNRALDTAQVHPSYAWSIVNVCVYRLWKMPKISQLLA